MTDTQDTAPVSQSWLAHFPISFFSVTMGLFGTALALHAAGLSVAGLALGYAAIAVFATLAAVYILKLLRHRTSVSDEWQHPIRIAFFPSISISLMLMAIFLRPDAPDLARAIWILGAAGQAVLTLAVVANWIGHRRFGPGHLSPAWFIPAVGNVVAPIAGGPLGFVEASWYFLSVGVLFWLILLTLVFNRLVFHDPLPGKLRPTLVILIAPPAVAFLAWLALNGGQIDAFARVLFNLGLFFTALVLTQIAGLLRVPFGLPFWALSFPFAAMTIAAFRFAALTGSALHMALGWGLLALLLVAIAGLVWRTTLAITRSEICVPE